MKKLYTYLCFDDFGKQDIVYQYIAETEEEAYDMFLNDTGSLTIGVTINEVLVDDLTEEEMREQL